MQQKERQVQNTIVHRCIWLSIARFKKSRTTDNCFSRLSPEGSPFICITLGCPHFLFSVNYFDYRLSKLCTTLKMFLPTQFQTWTLPLIVTQHWANFCKVKMLLKITNINLVSYDFRPPYNTNISRHFFARNRFFNCRNKGNHVQNNNITAQDIHGIISISKLLTLESWCDVRVKSFLWYTK